MERLITERSVSRTLFTKIANTLDNELATPTESSPHDIHAHYELLSKRAEMLLQIEENIKELWFSSGDLDQEKFIDECEKAEEYEVKWIKLKKRYEDYFNSINKVSDAASKINSPVNSIPPDNYNDYETLSQCPSTSGSNPNNFKRKFRLPKIELRQFDGQLKNWLSFWGQYKKIHTDETIDDEDKYQYLIQATQAGSVARELVESFPPSGQNYYKAIEQLKSRFARDELLVESYVRELLNLVLLQSKNKVLDLRTLYDKLTTQIHSLDTLGVTHDKYAAMLFPLVESSVPEEILRIWERIRPHDDKNTLTTFLAFLRKEVESEERIKIAKMNFNDDKGKNVYNKESTVNCFISGERNTNNNKIDKNKAEKSCIWCDNKNHTNVECFKISKMSYDEKKNFLKSKHCCFICLKKGHDAKICKMYPKCLNCKKRHIVVMCPNLGINQDQETVNSSNNEVRKQEVLLSYKNSTTLLQTLLVNIINNGKKVTVRALFDSGAQRSYLLNNIASTLSINAIGSETMGHCLFGGLETKTERHDIFPITVTSLDNTFSFNMTTLGKSNICGFLPRMRNGLFIDKLIQNNIMLTDRGDESMEVGLLIGADYAGYLLTGILVHLDNNLIALKTKLGWTVQGTISGMYCSSLNLLTTLTSLSNNDLSEFWTLETLGIRDSYEIKSRELLESEIINNFNESIIMNSENRYEVKLPWKEGYGKPDTNYQLSKIRLNSTTKKLLTTNNMREYDLIFKDWLQQNIIELSPEQSTISGHYLAHHAVVKNSSLTTKIRPVFDASAKDKNCVSINMCLEKGINFLELIPKLLINFRKSAIGIISDIKKAFLQISLHDQDREFMKFLWWKNIDTRDELVTYRHRRVPFGVSSSPFLLSATINYHLDNCSDRLRPTAQKLKSSFYVDNCVTSVNNIEEMRQFIDESKQLMSSANFDLRGWVTSPVKSDETENVSVLGIIWNVNSDDLYCNYNINYTDVNIDKLTKRYLLSIAQKIFDPIGFVCPTTLIPKIILQKIWNLQIKWDKVLPYEFQNEFKIWLEKLHYLTEIKIPRRITRFNINECKVEVHVFCDASKYAYATCIYLKTVNSDNNIDIQLILAKTRVSPIKEMTMPRLELMAALIGSRLLLQIKESELLIDNVYKVFCWTDSSVVFTWITKQDNWKPFVKNRVKEINSNTINAKWLHISGHANPADLPSRGCDAKTLLESNWWKGPKWLYKPEEEWDISNVNKEEVMDERSNIVNADIEIGNILFTDRLSYFSKFSKLIRMFAWILRFINNTTCKNKMYGILTYEEINTAEKMIFKIIQKETYKENFDYNKNLVTIEDKEGIIRVKTRLTLSEEPEEFKQPILLPSHNVIVFRLVRDKHIQLNHAGSETLISNLRERFWITGVRRLAKNIIKLCSICQRYSSRSIDPPLAPLPDNRIKYGKPFEVTGIDLAGPLILKSGEKCWIVLYTCAIYRAVHLESCNSLSTDSFMMSLRRFIARRGRVNVIYTDNGTNFVGAKNSLENIDWNDLQTRSSLHKLEWRLIPPGGPWWGGWWERMIRTLKEMLFRILGKASVNYVELTTILCDCEAVINSRPLTYIADNTENLVPLTPALFLNTLSSSNVSDIDFVDANGLNIRLKYLQKLRDDFRQRFRSEYLSMLIHRGKTGANRCLSVGDIVLIEGEGKRFNWPLGLVIELLTGIDGNVRAAKVKTTNGVKVRPVQKLYPLEINHDHDVENLINPNNKKYTKIKELNVPKATNKAQVTRSNRIIKIPDRLDL